MRKQYVDFLDRFDGGGAGQTGNSFQGGGLLSALGNIFATPYGSEDQARRAQRRQALGLLDTAAAPTPAKVKPAAPFAPRTAPPAGNITTSVLPPAMTGPMGTSFGAMGNPVDMSRDSAGMPPIPSHLTRPSVKQWYDHVQPEAVAVAIPQPPMPTASVQQPQPVPSMGQQGAALAGEAALMRANEYPHFGAWIDEFSQAYPGQTLNQYAELFLSLQGQQ